VDTDGMGVEAFTEHGIIANGKEYDVDVIILATGFEQPGLDTGGSRTAPHRLGYDIIGRGGRKLSEHWRPLGPQSFEAYTSHGFPNLFFQNAPFDVFTINFTHRLDEASIHFAHIISKVLKAGFQVIDTRAESEASFLDRLRKDQGESPIQAVGCTPGYYNNEGVQILQDAQRLAGLPHTAEPLQWFKELKKRRQEETALEGFVME